MTDIQKFDLACAILFPAAGLVVLAAMRRLDVAVRGLADIWAVARTLVGLPPRQQGGCDGGR